MLLCLHNLLSSPAAINFSNLPKDEKFKELFLAFGNAYQYIRYPDFQNKDSKKPALAAAENLYEYLQKQKRPSYDEELLKLLSMRCLYNYDEISSSEVEKAFFQLDKKYSNNAEHHWIYGNFLVTQGRTITGNDELEKYLDMKKNMIGSFFLEDYAYSQFLCAMPLHAYYTLTNGRNIPEEAIQNQSLLNLIKNSVKESLSDENYTSDQVWKVSQENEGWCYADSTMLGISFPVKERWGLKLEPFANNHPAFCIAAPKDFILNDKPIGISIMLMIYPESIYSENIKHKLLGGFPIIKEEKVEISKKEFIKYTYEDLSKYQDARKGSRGYFFTGKIIPGKYSGLRCEHKVDYSKVNSEKSSGQMKYYATAPSYKRLNEPVEIFILVDSCNALIKETDDLLDEIFSNTVFE